MNLFAEFETRIKSILTDKVIPEDKRGADLSRVVVEPPRDASHGDLATMPPWFCPSRWAWPARSRRRNHQASQGRRRCGRRRGRGAGLHQHPSLGRLLEPVPGGVIVEGETYGRSTIGGGPQGQCRICLGQSDRSDACRPLPQRRRRGFARQSADCRRLRRHQEYYINDAGSQIDTLARSVFLRYREALGETIGDIRKASIPATISCRSAGR